MTTRIGRDAPKTSLPPAPVPKTARPPAPAPKPVHSHAKDTFEAYRPASVRVSRSGTNDDSV